VGGIFFYGGIDSTFARMESKKISFIEEYEVTQRLLAKLPKVDALNTLVINVSPDYSSIITQRILHHLSSNGHLPHLDHVDVPYPGEHYEPYRATFRNKSETYSILYDKVVICEAAVLSGRNYTWIQEILYDRGFEKDDIISVALFEHKDSVFKCDYVGEHCDYMPDFHWETYNVNWL